MLLCCGPAVGVAWLDIGGLFVGVVRFDGGGGRELNEETDGQDCSANGNGGGGGNESIDVLLAPSCDETLLNVELAAVKKKMDKKEGYLPLYK